MRRIVSAIEEAPLGWGFIIICAEAIIAFRIALEITFSHVLNDVLSIYVSIVFFNAWFLALFFSLILYLSFVGKIAQKKVARVLLFGLPVILLPPIGLILGISDRIVFLVGTWKEVLYHAATFLMFHEYLGVFFAIEIIIFLIGVFFFLTLHGAVIRSFIGVIVAYGVLIFLGTEPVFFETILKSGSFGFSYDQRFAFLNIVLLTASGILIFFRERVGQARHILSRFRPRRMMFFFSLCIAMLMGALASGHFYFLNFSAGLLLFCFFIAHTLLINDMADVAVDRVSNPARPYPSGALGKGTMHFLHGAALVAMGAMLVVFQSPALFVITAVNIVLSVAYSTFRLRKNPFSFLLAAWGWGSAVLYGFFAQDPSSAFISTSALTLFYAFFLLLCFFIPVKDIKDIVGDAREGVRNFMTMAGYEKGKIVTAISASISFPAFAIVMDDALMLISSLFFSVCAGIFIMRYERFGERPLFLLLFFFLLLGIFVI
ncbi:MAG: UbiA family prenyltransferase [Candidatus Azambacteria bacterium]|nr:UbiA family prenyltransferase [Candidatus Azambacteria bacterium]